MRFLCLAGLDDVAAEQEQQAILTAGAGQEIAGQVADAAAEFVAAEAIVLDYLKAGSPQVAAFSEARRGMMEALEALSRRLR